MVPLPLPAKVTVHHAASLLACQLVLEVTVKAVFPAAALTFWLAGVTLNTGDPAAWVTVTVTSGSPVTVTVIVAVRLTSKVFCVYVAAILPFPFPDGVTVHHAALLLTVHAELEVTVKLVLPAGAVTF